MSLYQEGDRLRFEVADDGVGFAPPSLLAGHGIADRLDTVGGVLTIRSAPGATVAVRSVPGLRTLRHVTEQIR